MGKTASDLRKDGWPLDEIHEGGPAQEKGCSLEDFNAVGETTAVMVVEESKISPVSKNEILHVRELGEVAVI